MLTKYPSMLKTTRVYFGVLHPRLKKENVCDWLGVGNSGLLMLVCSNMRITGEFSIFGVTFNAAIWYSLEA